MGEGRRKLLKQTADVDEEKLLLKYDDADAHDNNKGDDGGGDDGIWSDVDNDSKSSDLDDTDSSDDSDDSDEEEQAKMEEDALVGNPLLLNSNDGGISNDMMLS